MGTWSYISLFCFYIYLKLSKVKYKQNKKTLGTNKKVTYFQALKFPSPTFLKTNTEEDRKRFVHIQNVNIQFHA